MYQFRYFGLTLRLNRGVFLPSETSLFLARLLEVYHGETVLDVGTGCGLLALVAAKKGGKVFAIDKSKRAIQCAKQNARKNRLSVLWKIGDWYQPFRNKKFDVIITNPPQTPLPSQKIQPTKRLLISGGYDGTEQIINVIHGAQKHLKRMGRLYIPVAEWTNWKRTLLMLRRCFFVSEIGMHQRCITNPLLIRHVLGLQKGGKANIRKDKDHYTFWVRVFCCTLNKPPKILYDIK